MIDIECLSFGDRVAENESKELHSYFIETDHWNKLKSGTVDIVFGSKGAGKSALYTLLIGMADVFSNDGIYLISAEKPTGQTVFSEIKSTPPTSENEFIMLWKVYICQLIIQYLVKNKNCNGSALSIKNKLIESGLIEEGDSLRRLLNSAMSFAKRIISIDSIEGGATIEGSLTGKITFKTPTSENRKLGFISVDEMLESLNQYLEEKNIKFWILFDRLDVAFDQDPDLERNSLRALFKVYRDIEDLEHIFLKIFLRDDIWKKVTDNGFRESSHITRATTIVWSPQSLLNLMILRVIKNKEVVENYNVEEDAIKESYERQIELYYKIFPDQVDAGEKQSGTFDWIVNRIRDGLGNIAPRELIHFHNEILIKESGLKAIGARKNQAPNTFSRQSIKTAVSEVSKVKIEQNLFAEYPELKDSINKLDGKKAEHNAETLALIWECDRDEVKRLATELVNIGFFEQRPAKDEGIYKIPFIYRPYLNIVQGKAFA